MHSIRKFTETAMQHRDVLEYRAQSRRYEPAIVYNRTRLKVKPIKTTRNQIFFTYAIHTEQLLFVHNLTADNLFYYPV